MDIPINILACIGGLAVLFTLFVLCLAFCIKPEPRLSKENREKRLRAIQEAHDEIDEFYKNK